MLNVEAAWDEVLLRLSVAAACGGVLGWDRESRSKPAGLRTNILVSLGAALFAIVGIELSTDVRADGGAAGTKVTALDGLGEFRLEGVPSGTYVLRLLLGEDEIVLPSIDVGERRA